MKINEVIKKYLGVDPKSENKEDMIHILRYKESGDWALAVGKSNKYWDKDWVWYDCCYDRVIWFDKDFILKKVGHEIVQDAGRLIGGKEVENIQIEPDEELLKALNK